MFGFGSGDQAIDGMPQRGLGPKNPKLLRARMREALDLILRCWNADEPFDYEGAFWQGKGIIRRSSPTSRHLREWLWVDAMAYREA